MQAASIKKLPRNIQSASIYKRDKFMRCSEPMKHTAKENQESPEEMQVGSTPKELAQKVGGG